MMERNMTGVLLNPARQRIVQFILSRETGTVNEIAAGLPDIPRPSIYRHIKILLDGGIIEVIEEHAIRGTLEKRYALKKVSDLGAIQETNHRIALDKMMSLTTCFTEYFSRDDVDPKLDIVGIYEAELHLSDIEMRQLLVEIEQLIKSYMGKEICEGRKLRRISTISSPVDFGEQ